MNTACSTATPTEYQPTIIEHRLLIERLVIQIAFLRSELKLGWEDFKRSPRVFVTRTIREFFHRTRTFLSTPNLIPAALVSIGLIVCAIVMTIQHDHSIRSYRPDGELVVVDAFTPVEIISGTSIGTDGAGRVGVNNGRGEGSGPTPKAAHGGGGGGNHNPIPAQAGKLPQPSEIQAPTPTAPPINPPALPAAGIDIDPALWKDVKAPVFGDPRSLSEAESKGRGDGEGIGSGRGMGIGAGDGPGYGPGKDGNTGGGSKEMGCCGSGGGEGDGIGGRPFSTSEIEQRARLLFKPEPQYTEEARQNQITGTVMLRVVFSSTGEVSQIRAVHTLPFGLTERAIAAARQIKFVPAMKGGHPVSVFMQLEYNFNLY